MAVDLPKTSQAAPPNFYTQAASMSGEGKKTKSASSGTDQEFLSNVTKLLSVLAKLGKTKPNGKSISKYTQAAADSMQDMLKAVYGDEEDQVPGADTQAADTGTEAGTGAGAGAGAAGAGAAPGAS